MFTPGPADERRLLMANYTGELVQPTRLYYHLSNKKTVLGVFKKLRCINYIPWLDAWQWIYENEAKKIHFENSYNKIPKDQRPIALGQFRIRGKDLILDVRSFDRALAAIEFFDKRINRRAAQIYKLRVVNHLLDASQPEARELVETPYDRFFDERDAEVSLPKADKIEADLNAIREQYEDDAERQVVMSDYFEELDKKPLPELEELPVYFYEEGLSGLRLTLMMRTIEAQEYWRGNTNVSRLNLIQERVTNMFDDLDEDELEEYELLDDSEDEPEETQTDDRLAEPDSKQPQSTTPDLVQPETATSADSEE
ncbi:MAG: hypothetical protein ACPGVO_13515 [Spirulinaceae cyanobacterium]